MVRSPVGQLLRHPARIVPLGFLTVIAIGTVLLMLPAARQGPYQADPLTALFTATSAVSLTGLIVVDTPSYWTTFGQGVIMGLFQVGGFGIMTAATLLALIVQRRVGLSNRMVAQLETKSSGLGDVRRLVARIGLILLVGETILGLFLTVRFWTAYDHQPGEALWHGFYHAVSAFTNSGFTTYTDNLTGFRDDWLINLPLMLAVVVGGLGFPVVFELLRRPRPVRKWSINTRITMLGTAILLPVGWFAMLALEWSNRGTLGQLGVADKVLAAAFYSVNARSAGFNTVDTTALHPETWAVTDVLMFIGGGSAGTAGGIKVTTFILLGYVIWSEIRGEREVIVGHRRIPNPAIRQALTIALLGVGLVALGTIGLLLLTDEPLDRVLFESVSAFGTTGLSTGITPQLPAAGKSILIGLMFIGRVGTIVVATALALRASRRLYRYPEERPIVG